MPPVTSTFLTEQYGPKQACSLTVARTGQCMGVPEDPAQSGPLTGSEGHTQKSKTAVLAGKLSTRVSVVTISQASFLDNLSTPLKPLLATSSHQPLLCLWDSPRISNISCDLIPCPLSGITHLVGPWRGHHQSIPVHLILQSVSIGGSPALHGVGRGSHQAPHAGRKQKDCSPQRLSLPLLFFFSCM